MSQNDVIHEITVKQEVMIQPTSCAVEWHLRTLKVSKLGMNIPCKPIPWLSRGAFASKHRFVIFDHDKRRLRRKCSVVFEGIGTYARGVVNLVLRS